MATDPVRSTTPPPPPTRRFGGTVTRQGSLKYNYRVQSAPPLSIKQFLRSATGVLVGAKQWQPSGKYRPPPFRGYLSPAVRERTKIVPPVWRSSSTARREKHPTSLSPERIIPKRVQEAVWHPPGQYREKPLTSLSPEKIVPERVQEPIWHPPGQYQEKPLTSLSPEKVMTPRPHEPVWRPTSKFEHKPVPYFDPPSLRWSLQELLRSMPELRPQTLHTSRSMSALRKSETIHET